MYRAWLADMRDAVKQVDFQNRPITWASENSWDPAFGLADVIGFNEYFGYFYSQDTDLSPKLEGVWEIESSFSSYQVQTVNLLRSTNISEFERISENSIVGFNASGTKKGIPKHPLDAVHTQYPDKPILITENDTRVWPLGNCGPAEQSGTEEWQAAKFDAPWQQVVERTDFIAGYTFWLRKNYKQRLSYQCDLNGSSTMNLMLFDSATKRLIYERFKRTVNSRP